MELTLKDTLIRFSKASTVVKEVLEREHNLKKLWKSLLPYIEDDDDVRIMQKLVYEVNNIDPTSETFRYPYEVDEYGNKRLPHIDQTRLNDVFKLKRVMLKMYRFLDGVNSLSYDCCRNE